jgi:hypothetical protein
MQGSTLRLTNVRASNFFGGASTFFVFFYMDQWEAGAFSGVAGNFSP